MLQNEPRVLAYPRGPQNLSQSLSPTYAVQTEDVHETYFSLPNSSSHTRTISKMPIDLETRGLLDHLKEESVVIATEETQLRSPYRKFHEHFKMPT